MNFTEISEDMNFCGSIESKEDIHIEGKMEGNISADGELYILPSGYAKADLNANELYIEGSLQGNIQNTAYVHLKSSSRVHGDIHCKNIKIDKGAKFSGSIIAQ